MSNKQFEKKCKEDDQCLARIFFTDHTECGEQQKIRENFAKFAVRLVEILQQNLRSSSTKLWADLTSTAVFTCHKGIDGYVNSRALSSGDVQD